MRLGYEGPAHMNLPANIAAVRDLLTERAMTAAELQPALREQGIVISATRLETLPDKYPEVFHRDASGRLTVHTLKFDDTDEPDDETEAVHDDVPPWLLTAPPEPLELNELVVLVSEVSGDVTNVGYVRLSDGRASCLADDGHLVAALKSATDGVGGVVCFGSTWSTHPLAGPLHQLGLPVIDLRLLALLDAPSRPRTTFGDLCVDLQVRLGDGGLLDQARAAADCLRLLLDRLDPADPSWRLAYACLVAGQNDLARLLTRVPLPDHPTSGLRCAPDPLLVPPTESAEAFASTNAWEPGARAAVRHVFANLDRLGFAPRRQQREVSQAIAETIDGGSRLAIEAPTGTGKTLAYLAPAVGRAARARRPVIVATATKVLQQQIRRDVGRLQAAGLFPAPFRQIFGVNNYICTREVAGHLEEGSPSTPAELWTALAVAARALSTSGSGAWDDVMDSDLVQRLPGYRISRDTLRTDSASCERRRCAWAAHCPLMSRTVGIQDDPGVVSVNHALLATWAAQAWQGVRAPGDILAEGGPDLIFDEAHELEDSLTAAGTTTIGRHELLTVAARVDGRVGVLRHLRRLERQGVPISNRQQLAAATKELRRRADHLGAAVLTYLHEYGGPDRTTVLRLGIVRTRPEYNAVVDAAREVGECLTYLTEQLMKISHALEPLVPTANQAGNSAGTRPRDHGTDRVVRTAWFKVVGTAQAIREASETVNYLRRLSDEHRWVYRLSAPMPDPTAAADTDDDWTFARIPIDVSAAFARGIVARAHSVTLTSATLTTGGTFDYLGSRLGISIEPGGTDPHHFTGIRVPSPFDHENQSAVVLTNHLPVPVGPQEQEFIEEFARDQVGFLSLSGGRTLSLFAARRRMQEVARIVREHEHALAERGVSLLVQGELGSAELAERFRADPGTVAYGVRSYWQGFDAPGETLSFVVIEKPPYPHPGDPVVAARIRAIADRGGDPFLSYVVPKTAILFAQAFGRLIRTETDRGVALIADRRMQSPSAANHILISTLPEPTLHVAHDRDDAWRYALRFVDGVEPDLTTALLLAGSEVDAALAELRLQPGEDPRPKLSEAARRLFGIEKLHDAQLEVMVAHLEGRDTLAVLPTGFGKSLCFQLPALLRPDNRATVVVSPLIALIKDQLDELRGRRRLHAVAGITSATPAAVRTETLRDLAAGKVRLLYVSPERLVRDPILVQALEAQDLAGLVVDEAHCVSAWGHDFRPEFRRVATAVSHLRRAPRMALTATATPAVADDISATLEMVRPHIVRQPADRPNLRFRVVKVGSERDRARELLRIVTALQETPGIVYTSRRTDAEELAGLLRNAGITARHYHAGMVPEQRAAVQDDFLADTTQVMVATKAFGMGVNKPNIGWVVHYDLPDSLDAYVQEAGRAARSPDLVGECVLMYSERDIARRYSYLDDAAAAERVAVTLRLHPLLREQRRRGADVVFDPEEMADKLNIDTDELNIALAWLERAGAIAQQPDCSARGVVHIGLREPEDTAERREFRELCTRLEVRPDVGRQLDFDEVTAKHGLDPDELERKLVTWSLERFLTFSSSRRYRRVTLLADGVDERAIAREVEQWTQWQRRQLGALVGYVREKHCRRAAIIEYFGFPRASCRDGQQACDRCGGSSVWQDLPLSKVPDPEHLVDVKLTVLQVVAWADAFPKGRYSERSLKAAVLGDEYANQRALTAGVRRCPQFGALRYLRAKERRWDEAVKELVDAGLLERVSARREDREYSALTVTARGRDLLGAGHV
jgi:ATP-dependent DNA helicase RecQ